MGAIVDVFETVASALGDEAERLAGTTGIVASAIAMRRHGLRVYADKTNKSLRHTYYT